jgi:hypothetical protein
MHFGTRPRLQIVIFCGASNKSHLRGSVWIGGSFSVYALGTFQAGHPLILLALHDIGRRLGISDEAKSNQTGAGNRKADHLILTFSSSSTSRRMASWLECISPRRLSQRDVHNKRPRED